MRAFGKHLSKLIEILSKFFKNKKNYNKIIIDITSIIPNKIEVEINLPEIRLIKAFDPSKPSVLIIDDQKGIISIVEDYMAECGVDSSQYNILSFYGNFAAFVMQATLERLKEEQALAKIDIAIIDIVLPGKKKINDRYTKYDGVDVAMYLNENFDLKNFAFYTGNIVSAYVGFINEKTEKFFRYFKKPMSEHIIYKGNGSEEEVIKEFCDLFKKEKYVV